MGLLKFAQLSLDVLKQRGSKYKYRHELTEEWIGYQYIWYNMYVSIVFICVCVCIFIYIYTYILQGHGIWNYFCLCQLWRSEDFGVLWCLDFSGVPVVNMFFPNKKLTPNDIILYLWILKWIVCVSSLTTVLLYLRGSLDTPYVFTNGKEWRIPARVRRSHERPSAKSFQRRSWPRQGFDEVNRFEQNTPFFWPCWACLWDEP